MLTDTEWLKATASGEGNCLEVRRVLDRVLVRDSKRPEVVAEFTEPAWQSLVEAAKTGDLDLNRLPCCGSVSMRGAAPR